MNSYESIFIAKPSLLDEEVGKMTEKIKGLIEQGGGSVLKVENWGKKKLAYEIHNEKKGTYVFLYFQAEGKVISELERAYRLDDSIIKFLTVKLTKKDLEQREWAKKREARPQSPEMSPELVAEDLPAAAGLPPPAGRAGAGQAGLKEGGEA